MNLRLTLTAGIAVILASFSLYPLIQNVSWFWAGVGAVITVALAGTLTRASVLRVAVGGSVLALIAVSPLLADGPWPVKAVGLVIVAVTAASRPRLRLVQALACVITYLAALLIYLNLIFAARLSVAGVIPTGTSVSHLRSLLGQGLDSRTLAPPVSGSPGVVLLAAGGIGLIAVLADLLAVRLRSPAMAGLPLLALYCVRITTSARQGGGGAALVFGLGVAGYLALLAADGRERLRLWGRLVTAWNNPSRAVTPDSVDTRALSAAGRRIGLAAACVALILPLLVPGVGLHDLLRADNSGPGPGGHAGGTVQLPDPVVQMKDQLLDASSQPVLSYQTTAADPPEQYLQVYVLNYNPAGGAWVLAPLGTSTQVGSRRLQRVPGLAAGTKAAHPRTRVTLSNSVSGYDSKLGFLPVPYAPSALTVSAGTWDEDNSTLMVYSTGTALSGLSYTVTSTEATPGAAQLTRTPAYRASIADNYMGFPSGVHDQLLTLARQITQGAVTPYQKAVKLQSYFTSGAFTYNVDIPAMPNNVAGLTQFLFTTKQGFCQQFAFAMAALARLVNIPSRIAVGYTAGTRTGRNTWKVTTSDAHAWPELYFTGVGWLRFEPTPGGAGGQGTATVPQYAPSTSVGSTGAPTAPLGSTVGTKGGVVGGPLGLPGIRPGSISAAHAAAPSGHGIVAWILLGIAAACVAALLAPLTARALLRRARLRTSGDAALAHAAWHEFRDSLADYGFGYRASETPRAVARRIAATVRMDSTASRAVTRIADAEERARYAAAPLGSDTLRADTVAVRQALSREATRQARWRARLLPRSTLGPLREALQHGLDVFGWMDAAGLRVRGAVRQQE